jgi:hypothetical protein
MSAYYVLLLKIRKHGQDNFENLPIISLRLFGDMQIGSSYWCNFIHLFMLCASWWWSKVVDPCLRETRDALLMGEKWWRESTCVHIHRAYLKLVISLVKSFHRNTDIHTSTAVSTIFIWLQHARNLVRSKKHARNLLQKSQEQGGGN